MATGTVCPKCITCNPGAPVLRATINETAKEMSATNARLYVMTNGAALKVFDLSTPTSPALLSTTQYGGTSFDYTCMTSWDSGATKADALGTATFGLWLIDATAGSNPQVVSVYQPVADYTVLSLAKGSGFLYVGSSGGSPSARLESLDVSSLSNPMLSYATGPGIGARSPSKFASLTYISGALGKFLLAAPCAGEMEDTASRTEAGGREVPFAARLDAGADGPRTRRWRPGLHPHLQRVPTNSSCG